jgi:hypothetical protein
MFERWHRRLVSLHRFCGVALPVHLGIAPVPAVASIAQATQLGAPSEFFFDESSLWSMRALALIPAIMLVAAILGVICFFHGPC